MGVGGRKLMGLAILEVLRRHSDAEHRLLQADIIEWLRRDYGASATRKTVRENLASLREAGYPLEYRGGWYYEHEFCRAELDLLIHGLAFNAYVPQSQRRALIEKLRLLGGEHYEPPAFPDEARAGNPQFLYTMEVVRGAVERERKIEFQYMDFDIDKRLHPRLDAQGAARTYLVNPYHVAMANGRYYLICNVDKYDNVAHFRLDRIAECRETAQAVKPMREVRGLEGGLRVQEYMAEHAYMYPGRAREVRIRAKRALVGDILDWFGMDVRFERADEEEVEAAFFAEEETLKFWLRRYGEGAQRID